MYEPDDKMIYLIRDNYDLLQSLGSFGISLGFGDKSVREVCDDQYIVKKNKITIAENVLIYPFLSFNFCEINEGTVRELYFSVCTLKAGATNFQLR